MFTRDLVIFDVECTGLNVAIHEIIQIAAIRIDKDSLEEVSRFATHIKPKNWENRDPAAMAVNKISYDVLAIAPDISKALELFESKFPVEEVLLTAYNSWFDMGFLYQAYQRLGKVVPFEKHAFDIWPFAYTYWSHAKPTPNPTKPIGFGLSDVASALGITAEGAYHDALTDCEVEAELLRRLTKTIRFQ